MTDYVTGKMKDIAKVMNPKLLSVSQFKPGDHFDVRPYQSTHITGGAIMGDSPKNSVVNKYLQSWDVPNLFVLGASCFPQNLAYNPTGMVGATAYFAAHAIRTQYLANPGPLIQA